MDNTCIEARTEGPIGAITFNRPEALSRWPFRHRPCRRGARFPAKARGGKHLSQRKAPND